jgi:hypothetical protein
MLSPLAGEMKRHTSSSPSGVSRLAAAALQQSSRRFHNRLELVTASCAWIHILTGVETLKATSGLE